MPENDPWTRMTGLRDLLLHAGEDPIREGLQETPRRVEDAWSERLDGYSMDPEDFLATTFENEGGENVQLVEDIWFSSTCEHHFLPFDGYCSIAYLPQDRVVGLSKLSRLVDCFAHRLQIQERMTFQIADALMQSPKLSARGVLVVVSASHSCCTGRGVRRERMNFVTTARRGEISSLLKYVLISNLQRRK